MCLCAPQELFELRCAAPLRDLLRLLHLPLLHLARRHHLQTNLLGAALAQRCGVPRRRACGWAAVLRPSFQVWYKIGELKRNRHMAIYIYYLHE